MYKRQDQINIDYDDLFIKEKKLNISYSSPISFITDQSIPVFTLVLRSKNNKGIFKGLNPMFNNEIYYSDFDVRKINLNSVCLLYTSPSPRDRTRSRMPSSA